MSECLTSDEIDRLHGGELPDRDESRLRDHVAGCRACAQAVSAGANRFDDLIHHLRKLDLSSAELEALQAERKPGSARSGSDETAVGSRSGVGPLPASNVFPGYEVTREIHHGGQGVVYQAIQHSTKRKVAIKVLLEGRYASSAARRRFEREIDLIAGLKHPDIVSIFDSGLTADGRQFYVMDFVAGLRLEKYVSEHRLSLDDALLLFARITDAVNYAHQRGVIHRDLKPWNIVVDSEGNPKILDFGLAKTVIDKVDPSVSISGQVMGTLPYMSPEQTRGKSEEIDIRTDVYALGVILYELLTGTYPYPVVGEMAEVLSNISRAIPKPPSRAWEPAKGIAFGDSTPRGRSRHGCPIDDEIETIILKSLSKERERRYQSAGELARDLRQYLAGEPIDAKRDSGWYVLRKTLRRHRIPLAAAAAFVVIITISAVALMFMYSDVRRLWAHSEEQTKIAESERDRALKAEALAKRRFDYVRELAHSFIFEFHDKIMDLAGSVPARQLLVTKALQYLGNLHESAGEDPELMREIASAYQKVGDVQGGPAYANIGDSAGALKSYEAARRLTEAAMKIDPSKQDADLRNLAVLDNDIGGIHTYQGEPEEALRHFLRAKDVFESRLERAPHDADAFQDVATAYSRIGEIHRRQRHFDEALSTLDKAREYCIRASEIEPTTLRFKHNLTIALSKIADVQIAMEDLEQARRSYEQVVSVNEEILRVEPDNARARRGTGIGHDGLAQIYSLRGEIDKAIEQFNASLELSKSQAEADPMNAVAQRDLYTSHGTMGSFYTKIGRLEEALIHFEKGVAIAKRLNESDPSSALAWLDLAAILGNYGSALLDAGKTEAGLIALQKAENAINELVRRDPTNPTGQRNLAITLQSLGFAHSRTAKAEGLSARERVAHLRLAVGYFEKSLAQFEKCRTAGYLYDDELYVLDENRNAISECQKSLTQIASPIPTSSPAG